VISLQWLDANVLCKRACQDRFIRGFLLQTRRTLYTSSGNGVGHDKCIIALKKPLQFAA